MKETKSAEEMQFPFDANGVQVKVGDRVRGEGFISFAPSGWKVDRTPIVDVSIKDGVLHFGFLSAKSFNKFWIVKTN